MNDYQCSRKGFLRAMSSVMAGAALGLTSQELAAAEQAPVVGCKRVSAETAEKKPKFSLHAKLMPSI